VNAARRYRVLFDPDAIAEDLEHATKAARQIGEQAVTRLSRDGITKEQLYACKAQERDGTRLAGCVKTYLPWPDGRCGMVLELRVDEHGPMLFCLAFGVRHPQRDSRRPSVYQVADRRVHQPDA
jgi:hypothetical protein